MFETYILPVLIFFGLALIAGLALSLASAFLGVKTDERVEKVRSALPGINCGACGFKGCDEYAQKVVEGEKTNRCVPGGDATSRKISEILGSQFEDVEEMVAYVRCNGTPDATGKKYEYAGPPSCAAANMYYGGNAACAYGCLGFGDCVKACRFDAIHVVDGVAQVDPSKCTGCERCTVECPKGLIAMRPLAKPVFVACANRQSGKETRAVCKNGCIACHKCEKSCPSDAIHVNDNLAAVDFSKCTVDGTCVEVCPVQCIINANDEHASGCSDCGTK